MYTVYIIRERESICVEGGTMRLTQRLAQCVDMDARVVQDMSSKGCYFEEAKTEADVR